MSDKDTRLVELLSKPISVVITRQILDTAIERSNKFNNNRGVERSRIKKILHALMECAESPFVEIFELHPTYLVADFYIRGSDIFTGIGEIKTQEMDRDPQSIIVSTAYNYMFVLDRYNFTVNQLILEYANWSAISINDTNDFCKDSLIKSMLGKELKFNFNSVWKYNPKTGSRDRVSLL
jgi:hypothetical protein